MKNKSFIIFFLFLNFVLLRSQNSNVNFELTAPGNYTSSNAVAGWTVESAVNSSTVGGCATLTNAVWSQTNPEFWIRQTPILSHPYIGNILPSPLGGSRVAQLNNTTPGFLISRLKRTIAVTNSNNFLSYAYCCSLDGNGHACCQQPFLKVNLYNCNGSLISCSSISLTAIGAYCIMGVGGYSITNGVSWSNWQVKHVDLTPYIGSCVTVELIVTDCTDGNHHGSVYFDAICGSSSGYLPGQGLNSQYQPIGIPQPVSFCAGSNQALICGPPGYEFYSWNGPNLSPPLPISQSSLSCITIPNPLPGTVYTLTMGNSPGCLYAIAYGLVYSTVTIAAIGASPSCSLGTSGSASVIANGSGTGYNYTWLNSSNSVIATSAIASNLSPGVYSVIATALGSPSCGTAMASTTVAAAIPSVINAIKPYCGAAVFLQVPPGSTNIQWYSGLAAISPSLGGTTPSWTVTSPVNGGVYRVVYFSIQGCSDSVEFTLMATLPGSLNVTSISEVCLGANNGSAVVVMSPAAGMPFSNGSYSVYSIGQTPPYASSLSPTSSYSFVVTGLSAGTYSVRAFDGSCQYGINFSVSPYLDDFTITPNGPTTLCPGNQLGISLSFTNPPTSGQFTYSWSPNQFFASNINTTTNVAISPSTSAGTQTTILYTVVVTPSAAPCPMTKTIAITAINPITPTIISVPAMCGNSGTISLSASPSAGFFSGNTGVSSTGVLNPMLCSPGTNSVVYSKPLGVCNGTTSSSFVIKNVPSLLTNGSNYLCIGESGTITLTGSNSYSWSNGTTSSSMVVTSTLLTPFLVAGTGTNGCTTSSVIQVVAVNFPTLSILGNLICNGQTGTMTASGAESYTWSNGQFSPSIVLSSSQNGSYTVSGSNYPHCSSTKTILVSEIPSPSITLPPDINFCSGNTLTITANGGVTYTWNTGAIGPTISISPAYNTTYIVRGSNANGCSHQDSLIASVILSPTLVVYGNYPICAGQSATLLAIGAHNFVWDNTFVGPQYVVTPAKTKTYILLGSYSNSCFSYKPVTVQVINCTSLEEQKEKNQIRIAPNPNSGKFTVENNTASHFALYDQLGKIVLEEHLAPGLHEINVITFPTGIYFIKLVGKDHQITSRVLVIE